MNQTKRPCQFCAQTRAKIRAVAQTIFRPKQLPSRKAAPQTPPSNRKR